MNKLPENPDEQMENNDAGGAPCQRGAVAVRIIDRLLGRGGSPGPDLEAAGAIVRDYAAYLESSAPLPGRLADAGGLPHDKQCIKEALGACISATGDPGLIEQLKYGYLMLCAWQPGIGERPIGVDFAGLDLEADPSTVAAEVAAGAGETRAWNARVKAEREALAFELMMLGV